MKKVGLILLCMASVVVGQNVLSILNVNDPRYPVGWPLATKFVSHDLIEPGWTTNMTENQYAIHRLNLEPAYRAIREQEVMTVEEAKQARITALRNIFSAIAVFENDWDNGSNYNNAQLLTVIRTHNRALQNLAPILRDLYIESQNN